MSSLPTEHRKLAAIMFTDMVGYSALSQRNEALALELLEEHRQLLRAVFPRHQGVEIKSTGDGFLVEFASALAAVQCAVEIQKGMRERNRSRSAERRIFVRIGIHLGDVVRRENDVFGDGVNIAARIEPLAEPGGVCVSRAVYEQIENKVDHALVQLSKPMLKNIQATVEVYRLLIDEPRAPQTREVSRQGPGRKLVLGLAMLAVVILGLVLAGKFPWRRTNSAAEGTNPGPTNDSAASVNASVPLPRVEFRLLHSFGRTNSEGVNGWGLVTLARDGFLYGCALKLGPGGSGSIYRVRTNGADYAVLHSFDRIRDGAEPTGGIIESREGVLYGTTFRGGTDDAGTIFRIGKDGSGFRVLHHFAASNDCRFPQSELLEGKDGRLYGTATGGGGRRLGGIFRINKDGSEYAITTDFYRGQPDDPRTPTGGLMQAPDGLIYGTTKAGGPRNSGTIFRLDASGRFIGASGLGPAEKGLTQPEGTLLLGSDGWLYGTCTQGGFADAGGIFRVSREGNNFTVLHEFGAIVDDARQPSAGLVEVGDGSLLGTSLAGGTVDKGTIFRINKDGRGYQTLHHFTGRLDDGGRCRSVLTPGAPGVYYSATLVGGNSGYGSVFELAVPDLAQAAAKKSAALR